MPGSWLERGAVRRADDDAPVDAAGICGADVHDDPRFALELDQRPAVDRFVERDVDLLKR